MMAVDPKAGEDRRTNASLRELFDVAYGLVEPFFDPDTGWAGQSLEHLAFRVLRENFPQLSSEEVHAVVISSHRRYIQQYPERSGHLKRPGDLPR